MKKPGKIILWLYLAFMAVLLLGLIAYFIGTPWGYLDFYSRANRHLDRYFGDAAQVTGVSYDFKLKRYESAAKVDGIPGSTFALCLDHRSEDPLMYNYYHLLLWEQELMARYQPAYPEFTLSFDLPVSGSPYVSPPVRRRNIPLYLHWKVPGIFSNGSASPSPQMLRRSAYSHW